MPDAIPPPHVFTYEANSSQPAVDSIDFDVVYPAGQHGQPCGGDAAVGLLRAVGGLAFSEARQFVRSVDIDHGNRRAAKLLQVGPELNISHAVARHEWMGLVGAISAAAARKFQAGPVRREKTNYQQPPAGSGCW